MEWAAHLPLVRGGGVSNIVTDSLSLLLLPFLTCFFFFLSELPCLTC